MAGGWQQLVGPLRLSRRRLGCAHHGRQRVSPSFVPGIIVLILGLGFGRRRLSKGIVEEVMGGRILGEEALGELQRGRGT